jgi:hypothetical protein
LKTFYIVAAVWEFLMALVPPVGLNWLTVACLAAGVVFLVLFATTKPDPKPSQERHS